MATLQELLKSTENKRKLFRMVQKETDGNWAFASSWYVERQRKLFKQQIEEIRSRKMKVQKQKLSKGEEDEELLKWWLQLKKELNN